MLAQFSPISMPGMIIILVIALLVFGNRLPEVARSIGRAMNEFKRGLKDVDDELSSDNTSQSQRKLDSSESDMSTSNTSNTADREPVHRNSQD